MANYASNHHHTNHRRRKRMNPYFLIGVLVVILALLLVVAVAISSTPNVKLRETLSVQAGSALPSAQDFLDENKKVTLSYGADYSALMSQLGDHTITIQWGNRSQNVTLRVYDDVKPTATVKSTVLSKEIPAADVFVTDIVDATSVTVTYATQPDAAKTQQPVTLVLTDAAGNQTVMESTLILDNSAPVITGAKDIAIYQGDAVAYRNGITVTDNADEAPVWNVDSSKVNLSQIGQYPLTYTATDAAGNTATVTVTVTVLEMRDTYVPLETIYAAVDAILADIIKPEMNLYQQVHAIYYWIRGNCVYSSAYHFKDDWRQAGYMMLDERFGDCFYYFGLCKLMLERLGIPNIDVEKVPNYDGDSMHYWHLVSIDGGETYFHVDTTPRKVATYFCLVTDKVMDDFSADYRNCFNRDKSLYPATPESTPW